MRLRPNSVSYASVFHAENLGRIKDHACRADRRTNILLIVYGGVNVNSELLLVIIGPDKPGFTSVIAVVADQLFINIRTFTSHNATTDIPSHRRPGIG